MPTAPDIESLYNFEDELESAFVEMFTAIPFNAYRQRDTDTKATPLVAFQLVMGAEGPAGRVKIRTVGAATYYMPDFFTATLNVGVVTNRNTNAGSHSSYVAKVRRYMAEWSARLTATQLPYHAIARLDMQSTQPQIDAGNDLDMSVLTYSLQFEIQKTVWPTT